MKFETFSFRAKFCVAMSCVEAEPQWRRRRKEANMAYTIDRFISPLGIILIELLNGGEEPILTLTTEILTGHIAVYHGDRIWRTEADPDWTLSETAHALIDLMQEADIPEDLREIGIAALQTSASRPWFGMVSAIV